MPPGPVLAALMALVDRSALNGHDLVTLMRARVRQLAYDQAELYADMVELAHCPPCGPDSAPEREPDMEEFAADELRAALRWSRRAAENQLDLAWQLVERLPRVWEGLHQGWIDLPKARVIIDNTVHLDESDARAVADSILELAGQLTTGQLAARIRTMVILLDPAGAKARYEVGLDGRRVVAEPNADGTANLTGYQLPAERVLAITDRINQLARTVRLPGDDRTIDQVRADILLELLEGHHTPNADATRRGVVDLRVDLATLAGLNERPGEIGGWGPVISDIARQVAAHQRHSEWWISVTDSDGQVMWNGTTRRRPTPKQRRHLQARQPNCLFPGCRTPASSSDLDHTQDWSKGGPTLTSNLGPLCRHDHRLKHEGNWQLKQLHPDTYTWTSPHGHQYSFETRPP